MATKYRICMHLYHVVSLASPWTATFQPRFNARFKKSMGEKTPTISLPRWQMDQVREFQWAWWHDELLGRPKKNGWAALPKVSGCLKLMHQESIGLNLGSYVTRGLVPPMPNPRVSRSCSCYVLDMVQGMSQWWFSHIRGFGHAQPSHSCPGYVAGHAPLCLGCLCCRNVLDVPVVPQNLRWIIFSVVKTGELTLISQVAKPK